MTGEVLGHPSLGSAFQDHAKSELERLQVSMKELDTQLATLQQERERVATAVDHLRGLLHIGDQNVTVSSGPLASAQPSRSRRAVDADLVVEYLQKTGEPTHYRRIYEALAERGLVVGGKDPANTLLARYFNDSRLQRVARGTYALSG